jgi:4-amino-4-deoxy-L-arabinose transferase-like glycosyltransferase
MNGAAVETFYGAAARSMSMSWHNFIFGSFDPRGTVTVDKLPGALWPQALSLRIFGFHTWALVLPQALEGVFSVLVLYRIVCRLAGPLGGLTAAALLAASPVTVALNRGNVSDSLLILLTLLATDATVVALSNGRLRWLLLAGVWVGLAFQAKMLQAWMILPALATAYLVAAPQPLAVRMRHTLAAGLVTVAISISWMTVVSLVPASDRPYVDGTTNNSVFSQVFDYNGIARLSHGSTVPGAGPSAGFLARLEQSRGTGSNLAEHVPPSWHRLLDGVYGRDIGWLLPAALTSVVAILLSRRRSGRRDPYRTAVVLWSLWLGVLWFFFSDGIYLHSYYVAALAPGLAALCGTGAGLAWDRRQSPIVMRLLGTAALTSLAYGIYLTSSGSGVPGWLVPLAVVLGAASALAAFAPALRERGRGKAIRLGAIMLALMVLPASASALMVTRGLGPFAAPFEPASATESRTAAKRATALSARIVELVGESYPSPIAFAIDTSNLAAPYILATGSEILPIGGFEGGIPAPSLARLQQYIASGELRAVFAPDGARDPRLLWIYAHCKRTEAATGGAVPLHIYDCAGA